MSKLIHIYRKLFWSSEKHARKMGVKIGKNCNIQKVSFGSEPYLIEIGNHVQITSGTQIYTHGGGWVLRDKYPEFDTFGKVIVKNNVYIGNNVLIMPGVTIEDNVIVAAGSVVTKSTPPNCVIAGNPARVIGDIDSFKAKMLKYNVRSKGMSYREKKRYLLSLPNGKFIQK